jgi:hypothetical protein
MKPRLFALVVVLSWNVPVMAQHSQMQKWLNTGTKEERVDKIVSLGVEQEPAELAVDDEVEWRVIRSETHQEMALLFMPCNGLSSSLLYLLKGTDQGWRVADEVGFDCHYDESVSFEVASLRSPKVDDVLVHHECEGRGTGFVQQNFNVFAIVSSRFKLVLSTDEIVIESDDRYELDQRSSFATRSTGAGSRVLEETRRSKENGKLTVEKRIFHWSPTESRFIPSQFVKVK